MPDILQRLTSHESLLAIGVSGVIFGLILRTLASSSRRSAALRQQHRLHDRKLGEAIEAEQTDRTASWFEKNLSVIANVVTVTGVLVTLLSFLRH